MTYSEYPTPEQVRRSLELDQDALLELSVKLAAAESNVVQLAQKNEALVRLVSGAPYGVSTSIDGAESYGYGELDDNGFFEFPLPTCLMEAWRRQFAHLRAERDAALATLQAAAEDAYRQEILYTDMERHSIGTDREYADKEDWIDSKIHEWEGDANAS